MTTTTTPLRERRRAETRQEIHRAAVDLVLARGLSQVTVDDIAEAAGVSPRTFFNYFPSKREALVTGPRPLSGEALARFVAGSGRLLDDLRELLVDYVRESPRERRELRRTHQLVTANPELAPLVRQQFFAFESEIADAVARRLGKETPAFEASVIAAVATAVLRAAVWDWRDSGDDTSLEDRLTGAFAAVRRLG